MHEHHEASSTLSFHEKIEHLVGHWIKHNDEHVKTYSQWAERLKENGMNDAAAILIDVARDAKKMNEKFQKVLAGLKD